MTDQPQRHRRWVLASRPHGEPTAEHFRLANGIWVAAIVLALILAFFLRETGSRKAA